MSSRIRALVCLLAFSVSETSGFQVVDSRRIQSSRIIKHESRSQLESEPSTMTELGLPPVIQSIVDERQEFRINCGRCMDTLRTDMQMILTKRPDFSIYHKDISLVDPSGVQVSGLMQYKSAFAFLQTFVNFWFSPSIQFRMVYDQCRSSIRISWHAVLMPKIPLGRPLHVDGISYYQLDSASGLIIEHKIEKLIINNTPVQPPYGILSLLQQEAFQMQPVGVGAGAMISHR